MFYFPTEIWIMITKRLKQLRFNEIKKKLETTLPLRLNIYSSFAGQHAAFRYHKQYLICSTSGQEHVTVGLYKYDASNCLVRNEHIPYLRELIYQVVPNFYIYSPVSVRDTLYGLEDVFAYEDFVIN